MKWVLAQQEEEVSDGLEKETSEEMMSKMPVASCKGEMRKCLYAHIK